MVNGITFKGIHSSKFGLIYKSDNRTALPNVTRFIKSVPSYEGTVDFCLDTYEERPLSVILQYNYKNDMTNLMDNIELIGGWLYNDGNYYDLIFDDQPNRKYKAKVVSQVDNKPGNSVTQLNVIFMCNSPHPFDLDNNPVSPADVQKRLLWDTATLDTNQYMQTFTSNGQMDFTVGGSLSVKPVIKLIGMIPSGLTLTCGAQSWKYTDTISYDGIRIDSTEETVTQMSDGASLFDHVDSANDDYFILAPGQQSISITGVSGEISLLVEFTPMEA